MTATSGTFAEAPLICTVDVKLWPAPMDVSPKQNAMAVSTNSPKSPESTQVSSGRVVCSPLSCTRSCDSSLNQPE